MELYGYLRFSLQKDFSTAWNYTTEVSLWLRIVYRKKRWKKYLLKVDEVHLMVFMFINGLHVHVGLFEKFHI